jgi:hypothetical protein
MTTRRAQRYGKTTRFPTLTILETIKIDMDAVIEEQGVSVTEFVEDAILEKIKRHKNG